MRIDADWSLCIIYKGSIYCHIFGHFNICFVFPSHWNICPTLSQSRSAANPIVCPVCKIAALLIVCPAHYCTAPYDRPHSRAKDQQVQNSFATKWQCNNCVMWQECDIIVFPLLSLSDVCHQCLAERSSCAPPSSRCLNQSGISGSHLRSCITGEDEGRLRVGEDMGESAVWPL